jgi:hypothetical protein
MEQPQRAVSATAGTSGFALIGPAFFSYVEAIAEEFRERGISVVTFDERHSNRLIDKILYRLGLYRHGYSPAARHLEGMIRAIEAVGITDVLLANVEAVDRAFVANLNARGIRAHLYMWDSIRNKPGFATFLDLVSSKGSFDPVDAERFGMTYVPLFAEPVFDRETMAGAETCEVDIAFCGTVHSSRTRILAALQAASRTRNLTVELMLYYHSRALFYVKGLVDRNVWKLARAVSSSPFSKRDIAAMFARAKFVLDVPHPGQTGMTARTFEVLLSGARLLTFNRLSASLLPDSLQPRITIIDRMEDAAGIDFSAAGKLPPLSPDERYFLSLGRFVDQLIDMMKAGAPGGAANL